MKRASYRNGIDFIACNDEPGEMDPDAIKGMPSVFLLAELFGVTQEKVAADVVRLRKKLAKKEQKQ